MRTSDPDIFAVGECAEVDGQVYGLVAPLYEMAGVLAAHLAGDAQAALHAECDSPTKLKVTGIDLFSAGDFADGEDREEIVLRDAARGVYKRLVLKDDRIIGAVLYGDTADGAWFFDLIKKGSDISAMRETLIFGPAFAGGSPLDPTAAVAALPDEAEICGCNGVCKGKITGAIGKLGLTTLDDVRAHTKASASCGSCTGLVEQLLELTLGDAYNPAAVQPMCGCTDLGHDDVRRLIVAKALKTMPDVMQALEWKTSCGCAKCRPALNYYLVCDWPGEYADDNQSRFINERVHANIQKDGTYSVVPRMWGGMTSAKELRAIADVVDKFEIPAVKVTGGQRIDMLGVKKEDLPAVWADLNKAGMVSGAAYAKGLRTVKTCVGTDWCRFGTQDSTGLGIKLEKFLWGSWTPAKVKMAVSGCPRNCAEATCKDVGVICVDSGYDIHFAGAAGLDIKGTEVLGHVATEDEAIEVIAALVQLYREQGRYLERIYKWAKRVGLDTVRRQIMDDARTPPGALRALRRLAEVRADRSLGRAGRGQGQRTSSSRWPTSRSRRPRNDGAIDELDRYRRARRRSPCAARGCVKTPGGCIAVFRTAADEVFAIEDRCPHKAGPLSQGIVHGNGVTCPLHNWVIDLATGAALGADEGQVKTVALKIDGDRLLLDVSALASRKAA